MRDELNKLNFKNKNKVVCVLLTNPNYVYFSHPKGFYVMLDEVIDAILKIYKNIPILLKVKPEMIRNFLEIEKRYKNKLIRITSCGLGAIASEAYLAISIQESTGLLEFSNLGIPTVEYRMINAIWRKYSPKSCTYDMLGIIRIKNKKDLYKAILNIKNKKVKKFTRTEIIKHIKHEENYRSLFDLVN